MYNWESSPTVTECIFSENLAGYNLFSWGYGGGMCNTYNSSPTLVDCTFSDNFSDMLGGGIYGGNSTINNCIFSGNQAGRGGAIDYSFLTATNCTFSGNNADGIGGAICLEESTVLIDCIFSNNHADEDGGGCYCWGSATSPMFTNCTFSSNTAGIDGGGIYLSQGNPMLTNCIFSDNHAYHYGGGIFNKANTTVTNCILWNDTPDEIFNDDYGSAIAAYSCIQGGYTGTGNIDADPLFVDPNNDDYHLTWLSRCINRGTKDGAPSEDMDGDPRPYIGTVDMGTDEFVGTHPLAADGFSVSEVTGGTVNFTLTGDLNNSGRGYILLGGVTGTAPGTPLPGGLETLRLNWDVFTDFVVSLINTPVFSDFLGNLDPSGSATAQLNAPPIPGFAGVTMHYAYALNNPWDFVSNPVAIEIVP